MTNPHDATHRIPGVPEHVDHPAGHQGATVRHHPVAGHGSRAHEHSRPPRFLPAWQRRVAAFFGREL